MSLAMVASLKEQGIDTIAATSHFYATQRSLRHFLERREEAYDQLRSELPADSPEILLGAEVLYYPGISHMEDLPDLCIGKTRILLLEMPFEKWSGYMIQEVLELARDSRIQILMAHIERYYQQQPTSVWDDFLDCGILMQSNADFFLAFRSRRKAVRLLREGRIHLLGSDCHNISTRAPHMQEACAKIRNKLGQSALDGIDELGRMLLTEERP